MPTTITKTVHRVKNIAANTETVTTNIKTETQVLLTNGEISTTTKEDTSTEILPLTTTPSHTTITLDPASKQQAPPLPPRPSYRPDNPCTPDTDATAQDATAQDATAQDATAQDATAQDATAQDATAQDATAQDATAQDATAQDATAQDATAQDATAQDADKQDADKQDADKQDADKQDADKQDADERAARDAQEEQDARDAKDAQEEQDASDAKEAQDALDADRKNNDVYIMLDVDMRGPGISIKYQTDRQDTEDAEEKDEEDDEAPVWEASAAWDHTDTCAAAAARPVTTLEHVKTYIDAMQQIAELDLLGDSIKARIKHLHATQYRQSLVDKYTASPAKHIYIWALPCFNESGTRSKDILGNIGYDIIVADYAVELARKKAALLYINKGMPLHTFYTISRGSFESVLACRSPLLYSDYFDSKMHGANTLLGEKGTPFIGLSATVIPEQEFIATFNVAFADGMIFSAHGSPDGTVPINNRAPNLQIVGQ
jgi:hypothetical protein